MPREPMDWPYIAGFFDGEGCLSFEHVGQGHERVRFRVVQAEDQGDVIWEIGRFFEWHGLHPRVDRSPPRGRRKAQLRLSLYRADEVNFVLTSLLPYLRVKQTRTREVLTMFKKGKTRRRVVVNA